MSLSIGQKILAVFGSFLLLIAALGTYQLDQLQILREINTTVVSQDIRTLDQLQHLADNQKSLQFLCAEALIRHLSINLKISNQDPAALKNAYQEQFTEARDRLRSIFTDMEAYTHTQGSAERIKAFREMITDLQHVAEDLNKIEHETEVLFKIIDDTDPTSDAEQYAKVTLLFADISKNMKHVWDLSDGLLAASHENSEATYNAVRQSYTLAFAGLLIAGIIFVLLLQRSIAHPLRSFMTFIEQIGRGDLTGRVTITRGDEIGRLGAHLNQMVAGLREVAEQTRSATENLNAATIQIRASTQEQAAGVEEQLAAVQQTSATLDEITQSGVQISRRAKEVAVSADAAMVSSQAGLHAVEDTTHAMDAIREQAESVAENIVVLSEKTQAVGEIIISVNDIAERSHLLALNAAIEAVAAGEHGRRFSVVATEIKNLADQAKEATAQVRTILGDIQRGINSSVMLTEEAVKRIAFGKEHTDATQRNIQEMSGNIRESVQTFQQIVAATNQHQIGLEQVMVALQNIRQASKQTADTTRQLDGAAANLNVLSQQLTHTVSGYQL
ncbi:methyl-accepting chemotaxis protein [Gammaproteobacteria bacterium]